MKLLVLLLQIHFLADVREYKDLDLVYRDTVPVYYHIFECNTRFIDCQGSIFYIATGGFTLTGGFEQGKSDHRVYVDRDRKYGYWILFMPEKKKLILIRGKRLVIVEGI